MKLLVIVTGHLSWSHWRFTLGVLFIATALIAILIGLAAYLLRE